MSLGELIIYLVVAMVCGVIGQALAGRSLGGCVISTIVGLLGAWLGSVVARSIGAPEPFAVVIGDRAIPILWSVVGAALVTFVVSHLRRSRGRVED